MPLSLDNREVLEHQVRRTIEFVERCFYEAGKMLGDSFLQPQDVRRALQLQQDLLILNEQLVLYRDEVTYLQTVSIDQPACLPSVGRFVLIESPFPKAIKKQAKAAVRNEKSVTVKLLTLARASVPPNPEVVHPEVVEVSAIQVLVSDDRADPQPIDQVSTKLDMKTLEGRFDSLKFNKATRCATARLIFRADVLASYTCGLDATVQITRSSVASYQLSSPFVVFANECQWEASEGKLLKYSIFKELPDRAVNIHCFTNHLQVHFWRGTRQDIGDERLSRPFSLCDLRYLSSLSLEGGCCFPRLDRIGEAEFDSFWSWFGQVFRLVRHTPVLNELWRDGLVSLMSRDEAENHLRRFPAGHFLLRFSESMPKGVVISSHHGSSHMEHWLVDTSQHMEKLFAILQADSRFEHVLVVIKDYFSPRRFTVESKNERFGSHFRPDTTVEKASKRYRRA